MYTCINCMILPLNGYSSEPPRLNVLNKYIKTQFLQKNFQILQLKKNLFILYKHVFVVYFPGGTISIVTREEHLHTVEQYIDKLEPLMKKLEDEGKWKQVKREIFKGFFLDKDGILWKYQVC